MNCRRRGGLPCGAAHRRTGVECFRKYLVLDRHGCLLVTTPSEIRASLRSCMPRVWIRNPWNPLLIANPHITALIDAPQTIAHHREGRDSSAFERGFQSNRTGVGQRVDNAVDFEGRCVKLLERANPLAKSIVKGAGNTHIARFWG